MRTLFLSLLLAAPAIAAERPNIILIGTEDISPHLGCYECKDSITPNLDAFAAQGARFNKAFTHAPVCAPTRSGMITGQYPTTLGSHHMRSKLVNIPLTYVDHLRNAGYFIAWPNAHGKTDFNFEVPKGFADTREDWTKNPGVLPKDKPFFAYANYIGTHESQVRAGKEAYKKNIARLKPEEIHDRAKVALPPYYPDTPAVRECVAKYHDNITALDYTFGDLMKMIDEQKWGDNTIVIFFGDHGMGMPRGKRTPLDSGLRVPLLIRWPAKIKPGTVRDDLTCFLDLAPTFLTLAGAEVPKEMVGRCIVGDKTGKAPEYIFGGRDRMDEAPDRVRTVRGERYRYVRNFMPELPYAAWINYQDEMPIMKDWRRLAFEGKLNDTQKLFFARTKPKEELYDLETDPFEVKNLADDPKLGDVKKAMSAVLEKWIVDTKDLGEVPEKELIERKIVKNVLATEYEARIKLHPKTPPVP